MKDCLSGQFFHFFKIIFYFCFDVAIIVLEHHVAAIYGLC